MCRNSVREPVANWRRPPDEPGSIVPHRRRIALAGSILAILALSVATARAAEPQWTVRQTETALELVRGDRPVLRYHTTVVEPPAGLDPVYRRSGFIHPIWTPAGRIVTADFPPDHAHQHGLFCAWVNTTFEGRPVDFWNQKGHTGSVEHVRVVEVDSKSSRPGFTVELRHVDLTAPGGPKPVLRELWTVRGHDGPESFLFDIESRQTCIADAPLVVNEYHYGGMAFRGSDQWFQAEGEPPTDFAFLTSDGLDRKEGNHTRPKWVAAHGSIDGHPCGLAVISRPQNFRYPEPVRLHPTKPYFVYSPCVLGEFRFEPGVTRTWRYRYVVWDGVFDGAKLDAAWWEYVGEQ